MTNASMTAKQIEHTKPNPAKRVEIAVGTPRGLYVVVQPTGKKSWAFRYRWHGTPRKVTFGSYPEKSLAAARGDANAAIAELEAGRDPAALKAEEENLEPNSAEAVAKEWLERDVKRTKTAYEVSRIMTKEVVPICKGKLITDIFRPDLMRLLDEIADRPALSAANHTLSILKRFFNWAVQRGYLQVSPAATINKREGERSRDRVLTEDELGDVWNSAPTLSYPAAPFLKVLLLTAQRRGEVAGMRWQDLNFENALWTLPKEQTKPGRVHDVPLSKPVLEILRGLPRFENGPYVFTTTDGAKPINGFSKLKTALDAAIAERQQTRMGKPKTGAEYTGYTLHDFRRTSATWIASNGTPPHVLSAILNHSAGNQMGITAIYNRHRYSAERRESLEKWAAYLEGLEGKQRQRKAG